MSRKYHQVEPSRPGPASGVPAPPAPASPSAGRGAERPACKTCRAFTATRPGYGECHAQPPRHQTMIDGAAVGVPTPVSETYWCLSHQDLAGAAR